MQLKWIFAFVVTMTAVASASPNLNFQVVIQTNDPVLTDGGQPSGDSFFFAGQVVVGQGGSVGIIAVDPSFNPILLYQAAGSNVVQTLSTGGDLVGGNANDPITAYDNLAISGNGSGATRVTYAAETNSGAGTNVGVFQQDIGVNASPQTVAFGNTGSIQFNLTSNPNLVPLQVNSSGQVIFAAQNSSGANTVYLGNLTSTTALFTDGDVPGVTLASQSNRLGIYTPGSPTVGAAVLKATNYDVYTVGGRSASQQTNAFDTQQTGPTILGTANYGKGNATLFYSQSGNNATYVLNDSSGALALDGFTAAEVTGVTPEVGIDAEMTPLGKIAAYVPDASGGHLDFYNAGAATPTGHPTLVAETGSTVVNDPTGPAAAHYVVTQLQIGLLAPMVNDVNNGVVVFDANINDTNSATDSNPTAGPHQALLEWQPGVDSGVPEVLLQVGDFIPGLSDPSDPSTAVSSIFVDGLDTESDVFKDGLSNDNYLAVEVTLDNGVSAVLLTNLSAVPEPAALAMIPLAGILLLGRRPRRVLAQ